MLIKQNTNTIPPKRHVNILVAACAATVMLFTAAPSFAAINTQTVEVKIDRAALENSYGLSKVYERLQHKAEHSCRNQGVSRLNNRNLKEACISELMDSFIQNIGHERLTAVHEQAIRTTG